MREDAQKTTTKESKKNRKRIEKCVSFNRFEYITVYYNQGRKDTPDGRAPEDLPLTQLKIEKRLREGITLILRSEGKKS